MYKKSMVAITFLLSLLTTFILFSADSLAYTSNHNGVAVLSAVPKVPNRLYEWRRVDTTPMRELTKTLDKWHAVNGDRIVLDVSFLVDKVEQKANMAQTYKTLANYINEAKKRNLKVDATAGDPRWIEYTYIVDILDATLRDYNKKYPALKFSSITYNVEPWTTPTWATDTTAVATKMLNWYSYLVTKHTNIQIGFDVPYWFTQTGGMSQITYKGIKAPLSQHLAKIALPHKNSFFVVMAYQNSLSRMVSVVKPWISLGIPYMIAGEIGPTEPTATWYNKSRTETFAAFNQVKQIYSQTPHFIGFDIDSAYYL